MRSTSGRRRAAPSPSGSRASTIARSGATSGPRANAARMSGTATTDRSSAARISSMAAISLPLELTRRPRPPATGRRWSAEAAAWAEPPPGGFQEGLVWGGGGGGGAARRHPVGDGGRGVVEILRLDQHLAQAEEALVQLREVDAAPQVAERHREVGVLHLPRH